MLAGLVFVGFLFEADRRWRAPARTAQHERVVDSYWEFHNLALEVEEMRGVVRVLDQNLTRMNIAYFKPLSRIFAFIVPLEYRVGLLGASEEPWMAKSMLLPAALHKDPADAESERDWCEKKNRAVLAANRLADEYNQRFDKNKAPAEIQNFTVTAVRESGVVLSNHGDALDPLPDPFLPLPVHPVRCGS